MAQKRQIKGQNKMMENNEEKILTLKSLDKDIRLKLDDIDKKFEEIEKKLEIVEKVLRR